MPSPNTCPVEADASLLRNLFAPSTAGARASLPTRVATSSGSTRVSSDKNPLLPWAIADSPDIKSLYESGPDFDWAVLLDVRYSDNSSSTTWVRVPDLYGPERLVGTLQRLDVDIMHGVPSVGTSIMTADGQCLGIAWLAFGLSFAGSVEGTAAVHAQKFAQLVLLHGLRGRFDVDGWTNAYKPRNADSTESLSMVAEALARSNLHKS